MLRVRATSRVLAVIGDPVAHSLSPQMHNAALAALGLDAVYVAFRASGEALPAVLEACGRLAIAGNLTVPLKQAAAALIPHLTSLASSLGAINTFWVEDGVLHGDNTDVAGLDEALDALKAQGPWLLCGTGGAARAVAAVAARRGVRLYVASRLPERAVRFVSWARVLGADATQANDDAVRTVINATPLGLDPADPPPVPPERLRGATAALDLVYAPGETAWVRVCRARGLRAADGRDVLVGQGAHAFERFFPGTRAPREVMRAAVARALRP